MAYLTLRVAGAIPRETLAALVRRVTELAAGVLGTKPELTAVTVEHVSSTHWFVAGKPLASERSTFHLDVKIAEGTHTRNAGAAFVAGVHSAAAGLLGPVDPASYVVVQEVPADAWGHAGMAQEMRGIEARQLPVNPRPARELRAGAL